MSIERFGKKPDKLVADLIKNKPGKHSDGGGLYLQVASPGQASWVWRHKERWQSIGPASLYSAAVARERAYAARPAADKGEDPFQLLASLRRPEKPAGKTFGEWLSKYLDKKEAQWAPSNRERER